MVDKVVLQSNERCVVDTSTNIVVVAAVAGDVSIADQSGTTVASLAGAHYEVYTLPANSGKYTISNTGSSVAVVYVFRMFYI